MEYWMMLTGMLFVSVAVVSYFLGCFNGAVIVSKYILRDDVRTHGSGNAGLTNFYRTFGGVLTFVVILTDVLKAVIAILLAGGLFGGGGDFFVVVGKYWAGLFCLLGHMFPCMFHFKGGKGILSGGTIAIMIDWRIALVVWGGFLILTAATRYVSLGSCWAGASFPVASILVYRWAFSDPAWTAEAWFVAALSVVIGGLVLWQHRGNIKRLVSGTESKFSFHRKKEEGK